MSQLLKRAAAMIHGYQKQMDRAGRPVADLEQGDIVFELMVMANSVDLFPVEKVSAILLEAGDIIKDAQIALEGREI